MSLHRTVRLSFTAPTLPGARKNSCYYRHLTEVETVRIHSLQHRNFLNFDPPRPLPAFHPHPLHGPRLRGKIA